jgi:hypothetical protein
LNNNNNNNMIDLTLQIGCGGTGGILAPMLARLLAYHTNSSSNIVFVDGDEFEENNRTRQLVGPAQLGMNKARALVDICLSQGLEDVTAVEQYVNEKHFERLVRDSSFPLIVCAVDNDATRSVILKYCMANLMDFFWISPGNADNSDGTSPIRGQVMWYGMQGIKTFGINPLDVFPQLADPQDRIPVAGSCANQAPSAPQLITSNAMAATITLAVIQNLLDNTLPESSYSAVFNAREGIKAATA